MVMVYQYIQITSTCQRAARMRADLETDCLFVLHARHWDGDWALYGR